MIDWNIINSIISDLIDNQKGYQLYIETRGIVVDTDTDTLLFDEYSIDYVSYCIHFVVIKNNQAHRDTHERGKEYKYGIVRTSNWYDIMYISRYSIENSQYKYQDARRIYDRINESKKMTNFWQVDLRITYL